MRDGDTLVVWKLDRLGRSLRHLIDTVNALSGRGVGLRSLQEALDTTTSGGKLVFHVFGALAEFERELKAFGHGVWELRDESADGRAFRVAYVLIVANAVHVLHAFEKRSQKTSRIDVAKIEARLKALKTRLKR